MNLVLFDFDGTITRDDSLLEFVAYVVGFKKFFRGILALSPVLAAYKLGLVNSIKFAKNTPPPTSKIS